MFFAFVHQIFHLDTYVQGRQSLKFSLNLEVYASASLLEILLIDSGNRIFSFTVNVSNRL